MSKYHQLYSRYAADSLYWLLIHQATLRKGEWIEGQREHKTPKHWPAKLSTSIQLALIFLPTSQEAFWFLLHLFWVGLVGISTPKPNQLK